ncbi:malto-oligosyltrehalose synthase [Deinococcus maricopensis]|uniref:Malto-oligosyltrehalose synthase n=1 Tax=Deinococcus maricopensis (strain DSM 21211 / LMG 22137 / NRRL B-23946 / LB-34) TaxID=709986 RepID=E8U8R3_DEIML|nr:malto-oligosyltrehalose synthase [Deinococcus maricopensis]ADV67452.1 malto-oligosyltrehalose synthase [Deinococcus maricopensis DSM 21211]
MTAPAEQAARIPRATYRLQLHAGFNFDAARRALPYLERLGVSDVYLSPIWQAAPGSTHGYNVTDHARVSDELGGERAFTRLARDARARGLGVLVDFVPNHMGVEGGANPYWEDVLEHGQASRYAHFFDIDWNPLRRGLQNRVLLPTLGDQYGRVLERNELQVTRTGGRLFLAYWERKLPLSPRTLAPLLTRAGALLTLGADDPSRLELASVALQAAHLPGATDALAREDRVMRAQEALVMRRRLEGLTEAAPEVGRALDAAITELNADPVKLDALISEQNYRLAYWRVAAEEINYRRFFDINDLAALRMEDPDVFDWAHSALLRLLGDGLITGVRLDHTDGLYDPRGYFEALQDRARAALGAAEADDKPLYVVAEKILEPGEALPASWAIHGTTGYDFLAQLNGVFVNERAERDFTRAFRWFTGAEASYGETLHSTKHLIQRVSLSSEVNVLAEHLLRIAEADLRSRDFTLSSLRDAIREVIAAFPVYRSYVREDGSREPGDDAHIRAAVRDARRLNRDLDPTVLQYLEDVLLLRAPDEAHRAAYAGFALRFQQLTGPVTAKGAEDTAFYRYVRLVALNEVGGDPALFGTSLNAFHKETRGRADAWPHAMLATSTHDTKRGEDTRARLTALTEMPQVWADAIETLSDVGEEYARDLGGVRAPSRADEYAFYQNALGAWTGVTDEAFVGRMVDYMLKAAREAKVHTSWAQQDEAYEGALTDFVRGLLADERAVGVLRDLHERTRVAGASNGLAATLVRLTAPGVPDTYQGSEGWNLSLVDPDNRRPVPYPALGRTLTRIEREAARNALKLAQTLLRDFMTGDVKLLVTWAALQARRAHPELFMHGTYTPITAGRHVLAFARTHGAQVAVTVTPRLTALLTRDPHAWAVGAAWGSRTLPLPSAGVYVNVLTGERHRARGREPRLPLAALLRTFPLALLIRQDT